MPMDSAVEVAAWPEVAPLSATRRSEICEHLRVPYSVGGLCARDYTRRRWLERIDAAQGASLLWPADDHLPTAPVMATLRTPRGSEIPLYARILSDDAVRERLGDEAARWWASAGVFAADAQQLGSLWCDNAGNVLLPFDPDEVLVNFWSERYVDRSRSSGRGLARRALLRTYYRVRGLLPRSLQIALRRRYARVQARASFPRWPVEPALHDFLDLFLGLLADVAGDEVPYLEPWPDGHRWALVLTHDVETAAGLVAMPALAEVEREHGVRSCWNFVPRRYEVPDRLVRDLQREGFEVGVHGLYHDGRDLASLAGLRSRLPAMHAAAVRWRAVGFRSPALHRRWDWMPQLGFDYDSSYPDTDPYEPQPGGCCSWWPHLHGELVELPLTMAQDHTLFVILGHRDETVWTTKADVLRERGGMALIDTHPDYLRHGPGLDAYARLLDRYAADPECWTALPREVSTWWRRRADSTIVGGPGHWAVVGPGRDEARIALARGQTGISRALELAR